MNLDAEQIGRFPRLKFLGRAAALLSLLLYLTSVFGFILQPSYLAAFTVVPIWIWGGIGMILSAAAWYYFYVLHAGTLTVVWVGSLLLLTDEARVIFNGNTPPLPAKTQPNQFRQTLRVITLNCANFHHGNPIADLVHWQPDIVLLQDLFPHQVAQISHALYGESGRFRAYRTNGIATRAEILRETPHTQHRTQQLTLKLSNGKLLEVVNIHLATAATDLRLWEKSAWTNHKNSRLIRQQELSENLRILAQSTSPKTPTLFGGDFNAPASDPLHRQLPKSFADSFAVAGSGWGGTYQRRFPILRIDHLYASAHLTPLHSAAFTTRNSDHRLVVTDFLFN